MRKKCGEETYHKKYRKVENDVERLERVYDPDIAFQMSFGLRIIPLLILLFFVKEPKVKEK